MYQPYERSAKVSVAKMYRVRVRRGKSLNQIECWTLNQLKQGVIKRLNKVLINVSDIVDFWLQPMVIKKGAQRRPFRM